MAVSPVRQHHMVLPAIGPENMESVREIVRILLRMWRKSELEFVTELGVTELQTQPLLHGKQVWFRISHAADREER